MAHPIWKDYYVGLTDASAGSIPFRIIHRGEVIYTGRAFARPGEQTISIRINDICADYMLKTNMWNQDNAFVTQHFVGDWEDVDEVEFINDWSYDEAHDAQRDGLASPINGRIDSRQWLIYSAYEKKSVRAQITLKDGSSFAYIIPLVISPDFNADYNDDFSKSVQSSATDTAVIDLVKFGAVASVEIDGHRYEVAEGCNRYALYYLNAFGGWDSLLIEGNHLEADNVTRHTREMEYNNSTPMNRGRQNYVNEVEKTLTLHTSWMSDESSARMHHLMNSTDVYLYDMEKGEMIPVLLANSSTEYKTYKNNGNKFVNYTIQVAFANRRTRR